MTTGIKPHKINASASGFATGLAIHAEYESACLRYMLVAPKAPFPSIDPLFGRVGAHHEDWYAERLGDQVAEREFVMKSEVLPGVTYSSRCDFITKDGVVHETKASFSKNFLYSVINKGEYKKSHLAQLVSYLIELKKTKGRIIAGYYEENERGEYIQRGFREFEVLIQEDGRITVDNLDTGFTAHDQLMHRQLAARILSKQIVHDRPVKTGYSSPCTYCPMSATCDQYDAQEIGKDKFIEYGIEAIKNKKPLTAKVLKMREKK